MLSSESYFGSRSSWRVSTDDVEHVARSVLSLARQHRKAVAAIGVTSPADATPQHLRNLLAAALEAIGLPGVAISISQGQGPVRLEVIEFEP